MSARMCMYTESLIALEHSSDKEELDAEGVASMLGLHSYWDAAYADELANFHEHGHAGEVWYIFFYSFNFLCIRKTSCYSVYVMMKVDVCCLTMEI